MATRTIKGIPDEDWMEFKVLAASTGNRMGDVFRAMLRAYEKEKKKFWKDIFSMKPLMSEKDAEVFEKNIKALRQSAGFRNDLSL